MYHILSDAIFNSIRKNYYSIFSSKIDEFLSQFVAATAAPQPRICDDLHLPLKCVQTFATIIIIITTSSLDRFSRSLSFSLLKIHIYNRSRDTKRPTDTLLRIRYIKTYNCLLRERQQQASFRYPLLTSKNRQLR